MQQNENAPHLDDAGRSDALDGLRREIDRLDDAMLALVEQRVAAAMDIAEIKRSDKDSRLRMRPAREAAVVERMVAQAQRSPERLVRQVWQEIMASCLNLQIHTELFLHAEREAATLTDAMRRRFGCAGRMTVVTSAQEALDAARTREAVAIVELAPDSDWWIALKEDTILSMFECLRDGEGKVIGIAVGRIAAEDLKACPPIRIGNGNIAGERLATANGLELVLETAR